MDYENGWNFIFLFLLLASCLLTFKSRKVAWIIKQIGLICILLTLGFKVPFVGIIVTLLIIYYSINKVSAQFYIMRNEKVKYYSISAVFAIVLLIGYMFLGILDY